MIERGENLTWRLPPGSPPGPTPAGPAHCSRHRLQPPASRQEGVCPTRARTRAPPPACCRLPDVALEMPRTSLPLSRSQVFSRPLAPLLSLPMAEHDHRHRRRSPRPEPLPRLSVVSRRTAPSPYSSSPSRTGREALLHPERRRLLPRDLAIPVVAPSSAGLPQA